MGDNRKEMDPSGQEHIEGEQNGHTIRPLVAEQNVNPSADEIRKAKKRATDKKCRDGKKQKIEETERQLENERAAHAKLEKKYATLKGKLKQSEPIIKTCMLLQQTVEEQNKITKQQNTTIEQQTNMISILMQQLVPGTTGFETGEIGLPVVHHQPGGPVIPESLPQLHQGGPPYPPLSDGGLTRGADPFDSHGFNYTSPPGADMVSNSSLMEGPLAPGGQLSWGITSGNAFGTGEAGPSVHHPPVYPSGTTIRPEGPAIEYPPELSQSHLPQGWPRENNNEQPTSYNADQFRGVN